MPTIYGGLPLGITGGETVTTLCPVRVDAYGGPVPNHFAIINIAVILASPISPDAAAITLPRWIVRASLNSVPSLLPNLLSTTTLVGENACSK